MQRIGVWHITENGPQLARACAIDLEQHLEQWIAANPGMVQHGLRIVGRQVRTEAGPLDLLALDLQGRWVLIEVKRGRLHRETVAQALDYVSCLSRTPFDQLCQRLAAPENAMGLTPETLASILQERQADEAPDSCDREVLVLLVGTSMAPGLERMISFLSTRYEVPIELVTFNAVETGCGQKMLVRELTETEAKPCSVSHTPTSPRLTVEDILAKADQDGAGERFRNLHAAALQHGLVARPYKKCIMYAPAQHKNRCLIAVWVRHTPGQALTLYLCPGTFAEFYDIEEQQAVQILGSQGYRDGTDACVLDLIQRVGVFFDRVGGTSEQ